jgi:hypothetical protein
MELDRAHCFPFDVKCRGTLWAGRGYSGFGYLRIDDAEEPDVIDATLRPNCTLFTSVVKAKGEVFYSWRRLSCVT